MRTVHALQCICLASRSAYRDHGCDSSSSSDGIGRRCDGSEKVRTNGAPDVTNISLTRFGSVLHVASAPDPRDGNAVEVGAASVHALLEGAGDGAEVGAPVAITALDRGDSVGIAVIEVPDTEE